jgi:hypothetical protein
VEQLQFGIGLSGVLSGPPSTSFTRQVRFEVVMRINFFLGVERSGHVSSELLLASQAPLRLVRPIMVAPGLCPPLRAPGPSGAGFNRRTGRVSGLTADTIRFFAKTIAIYNYFVKGKGRLLQH